MPLGYVFLSAVRNEDMRAFYLDTSAINSLHDDPRATELIEAIKKSAHVYTSVFTIAELHRQLIKTAALLC